VELAILTGLAAGVVVVAHRFSAQMKIEPSPKTIEAEHRERVMVVIQVGGEFGFMTRIVTHAEMRLCTRIATGTLWF
jgi:hypothetical protein